MTIVRDSTLQDVDTVTGPDSYSTGGFTVSTDVARADVASAESMDGDYDADVASYSDNEITIEVYGEAGTEVSDGTDLSGVMFSYSAIKK